MIDMKQKYSTITFKWRTRNTEDQCTLHDRTYPEALKVAKAFGYVEPKWYKPWSWANYLVVQADY